MIGAHKFERITGLSGVFPTHYNPNMIVSLLDTDVNI